MVSPELVPPAYRCWPAPGRGFNESLGTVLYTLHVLTSLYIQISELSEMCE